MVDRLVDNLTGPFSLLSFPKAFDTEGDWRHRLYKGEEEAISVLSEKEALSQSRGNRGDETVEKQHERIRFSAQEGQTASGVVEGIESSAMLAVEFEALLG